VMSGMPRETGIAAEDELKWLKGKAESRPQKLERGGREMWHFAGGRAAEGCSAVQRRWGRVRQVAIGLVGRVERAQGEWSGHCQ